MRQKTKLENLAGHYNISKLGLSLVQLQSQLVIGLSATKENCLEYNLIAVHELHACVNVNQAPCGLSGTLGTLRPA